MKELAQQLLELEGEKIHIVSHEDQVISDDALNALLDRSPEVFASRSEGWTSNKVQGQKPGGEATFEVYEQKMDEASEGLARLMGENDT